mmetsp:Transcript_4100/g.10341  ORF Transcript_4100/g.10341 Transcript_4100/m.10341 type:complete len:229 (-) Transcript_4100:758-1444(-)
MRCAAAADCRAIASARRVSRVEGSARSIARGNVYQSYASSSSSMSASSRGPSGGGSAAYSTCTSVRWVLPLYSAMGGTSGTATTSVAPSIEQSSEMARTAVCSGVSVSIGTTDGIRIPTHFGGASRLRTKTHRFPRRMIAPISSSPASSSTAGASAPAAVGGLANCSAISAVRSVISCSCIFVYLLTTISNSDNHNVRPTVSNRSGSKGQPPSAAPPCPTTACPSSSK